MHTIKSYGLRLKLETDGKGVLMIMLGDGSTMKENLRTFGCGREMSIHLLSLIEIIAYHHDFPLKSKLILEKLIQDLEDA